MKAHGFEIRQAAPQDADQILACLHTAFAPYRDLYTPAAFADTVLDTTSLKERMQGMHVLVATVAGQIIGTISGAPCGGGEGHLRGMAVMPSHQGSGIAKNLLNAIERWLKENGCDRVTLDTTLPLQAAMRFYERNGYKRSGSTTDFFGMQLIEYIKKL